MCYLVSKNLENRCIRLRKWNQGNLTIDEAEDIIKDEEGVGSGGDEVEGLREL